MEILYHMFGYFEAIGRFSPLQKGSKWVLSSSPKGLYVWNIQSHSALIEIYGKINL